MLTVQIEHPIRDFKSWRAAFDSDPAGRQQAGVRGYRILRPVDDSNRIIIDLDFESPGEAEAFVAEMRKIWNRVEGTIIMSPTARILETIETVEYSP